MATKVITSNCGQVIPVLMGKKRWATPSAKQLAKDAKADKQYKTRDVFQHRKISWKSGKYKGTPKKITVDIAELYPSQGTVQAAVVNLYYTGKRKDKGGPDVVELEGHYVIADGHHRLAADLVDGKKDIEVNLYPVVKGVDDVDKLSSAQAGQLATAIAKAVLPLLSKGQALLKARRHLMVVEPGRPTVKVRRGRRRLRSLLDKFFAQAMENVAKSLKRNYGKAAKAKDPDRVITLAYDSIDWADMVDDAEQILADVAEEGGLVGLGQLDISTDDAFAAVNQGARDFARERAAEMVGMRRTASGKLVRNPSAQWAISSTTRDDLRDVITNAFEANTAWGELVDQIKASGIFSASRAEMIAETEAAHAQVEGNLGAWRDTGVVQTVDWVTSGDHDVDDECDENEQGGPYPIDDVPDLPAHPRCECALVPADIGEAEEE